MQRNHLEARPPAQPKVRCGRLFTHEDRVSVLYRELVGVVRIVYRYMGITSRGGRGQVYKRFKP